MYIYNSENSTILNNQILNSDSAQGLSLYSTKNSYIYNNTIANMSYHGIMISDSFNVTTDTNGIENITSLVMYPDGLRLYLEDGITQSNSDNCTIYNNSLVLTSGILLESSSDNNTVINNTISECNYGIRTQFSNENVIANNTIHDNGIRVENSQNTLIKSNIIDIDTIISRTGYTAEDGFELYFPINETEKMWNKLLEAGEEYGLKPIGLGARDTLRIEACYSLYGHETNETITPIEAGLGWNVKLKKDFIGHSILKKQKKYGTERVLVPFEMIDKAIPRTNYEIFSDNNKIGYVTSGTFSPTFKKPLGMALLKKEFSQIGNNINIKIREKFYNAVVVKRPFYKYMGGKNGKSERP